MRSRKESATIAYEAFDEERHLPGVAGLLRSIGWDNFRHDPSLTRRSRTAPGVTTIVAVAHDPVRVVGFAQVFDDGVIQAHPGLLAVDDGWRRRGIGRGLVDEALARTGAERTDLASSDEGLGFYRSLEHGEQVGFRTKPGRREEG